MTAALASCGDDKKKSETPVSSDSALCRRICERSAAADCQNDPTDCTEQCRALVSGSPTECRDELTAFTKCAEKASFTCDDDGQSLAKNCSAQLSAWSACSGFDDDVASGDDDDDDGDDDGTTGSSGGGPTAPDASTPTAPPSSSPRSPEGGICAEAADDSACDTCAKDACCDELSKCGVECSKRVSCISACSTQDCIVGCLEAVDPEVSLEVIAVVQCLADSCDVPCSAGAPNANIPPTTELPTDCQPAASAPEGSCDLTDTPNAYECESPPFPDCVQATGGAPTLYCCRQ